MINSFECDLCGGTVERTAKPGRMREYRPGVPPLPIPDDYVLPVCKECGELYISEESAKRLDELQRPAFMEWQKATVGRLIEKIQRATPGITNREIERICGVTPTYLSHILHGRKEIGQTLLNYLEALALYPEEVHRRRSGKSFDQSYLQSCGAALSNRCSSRSQYVPYVPSPQRCPVDASGGVDDGPDSLAVGA